MAMTSAGFLTRLQSGRVVNCTYGTAKTTGLISAWLLEEDFILTWEECLHGEQYNESSYIRDERHRFSTAEEVLAFVEQNGHPASSFSP